MEALRFYAKNSSSGHSFLITGQDERSVTILAEWFSRRAVCTSDGPEPCGSCSGCASVLRNDQQFVLTPERDDRGKYSIAAIRAIRANLQLLPAGTTQRVVFIPDAENLSLAAANALLKILEEPGIRCRFVLASTQPLHVPATVRSRTVRVFVQPVPIARMQEVLHQGGIAVGDVALLTKVFPGQLSRAWECAHSPESLTAVKQYDRMATALLNSALAERLHVVDVLLPGKTDAGQTRAVLGNFLACFAKHVPKTHLAHVLNTCRTLRTNANPRLALESLFLSTL